MQNFPKIFFIISITSILSCNNDSPVSKEKPKNKVNESNITSENSKEEIKWFWFEKNEETRVELMFSERMKKELKRFNPDFKLYTYNDFVKTCGGLEASYFKNPNPPFATIGDFNADGMDDITLLGYSKEKTFFMAVLSNAERSSFTFTNFMIWDYLDPKKEFLDDETNLGLSIYIFTQKRSGEINGKQQEVDQIIIENCQKASQGFYFEGSNLKANIVSD